MRFWKFIKDELNEKQEQQSSQNNAISEEQKISDKLQQEDEEEQQTQSQNNSSEQIQEIHQQSNGSKQIENQEISNEVQQGDKQNDQLDEEQNTSNNSTNDDTNSRENQRMNDRQCSQEERKDKQSQKQSSSPKESQELSPTPSRLKQSENQEISNEAQQEDKQNDPLNEEQNTSNNSTNDDMNSRENQKMNDRQCSQEERKDKQSQKQSSSPKESLELSQQSSDLQQNEKKEISDNKTQQREENKKASFSNEAEDSKEEISSEKEIERISEEIINNHKFTSEQKRELLEKLKKSIEEIRKRKAEKLHREHINHKNRELLEESKEEKYELSEQTNNFLNQLGELPSFEDRDRGTGYSIDTESYTEIPESVIRTLIIKFLNQRFCRHNTDLNVRSNSLEKSKGFYKWEVKDVIIHLQTHQITKVLTDKYGYDYAQGKSENVPLSFYFDMSGSMSKYTNMLAVIAIELLKKGVKVLVGFNDRVNVQIESIEKNITVSELANILESAGYWDSWGYSGRDEYKKDPRVKSKYIERNIDNYLIDKKAEKCVVFADFDPKNEIINLSQVADVYWFCFESRYDSYDIGNFNGFIYKVQSIEDLEQGLLKVNEKRFETLCYTDNPKSLRKKVRGKR